VVSSIISLHQSPLGIHPYRPFCFGSDNLLYQSNGRDSRTRAIWHSMVGLAGWRGSYSRPANNEVDGEEEGDMMEMVADITLIG